MTPPARIPFRTLAFPALAVPALALPLIALAAAPRPAIAADGDVVLQELFVTATARPEERSRIAGTTQTIDQATIEKSGGKSLTDLLAENAVGFFSEWTAGQTSINIRGASTDGQGRDFRGQILVLINGRRAGTANLSKLSMADVERIEIVRGPASVVYGSQNMGGVINIIMKTGRTSPGSMAEVSGGSWGLLQGKAQTGGGFDRIDWYVGASASRRGDYDTGRGTSEKNTAWERKGVTGSLGLQLDDNNRIEFLARTDGIYDAGFRGSGANTLDKEDRYNRSFDASYTGATPDGRFGWFAQTYFASDIDVFKWGSPVVKNGVLPGPGTSLDYNTRHLDIVGTRLQPRVKPWQGNDLLLGWDWEQSQLRSDRFRINLPGGATGQAAPYDNNQTDLVHGLYFEDAQNFWNDRLTLRGGVRQTYGQTTFDATPNVAAQRTSTRDYDATTYSAGATLKTWDWMTLRAGASSGFRAPTASELAADFTAVGGGRTFGNASLRPETNDQLEIGSIFSASNWRLDTALFQNKIHDRIVTLARPGVANTSDYTNNPADVVVRGLEAGFTLDLLKTLGQDKGPWRWSLLSSGYYNFTMRDKGAAASLNTNRVQRMYQYEGTIGTRFGQSGPDVREWSMQITGLLRGPMWYDTEENLLIPLGEPNSTFIHRKSPFWTWNLHGDVEIASGFRLFGTINNLFNVNQSPIFIATDQANCIADTRFQNGGCGTSMPGREFIVGLQARF